MARQIPLDDSDRAPDIYQENSLHVVEPDIAYLRLAIVNAVFFGTRGAGDRGWVLIDAGVHGSAGTIRKAAASHFGEGARPAAIVMTHGHFDHVGALETLAEEWDVPVYAHPLERPFLDGTEKYPPSDPAVSGLMARLSPLYPRSPVNVGNRLVDLPANGSVPFMIGWSWIHTPGHTRGHVSLWRPITGTLVAGDAIVTTGQESAYEALVQEPEMHGPPAYLTPDWVSSEVSVKKLAALEPELVVTGHGRAMQGPKMQAALRQLATNFREIAVPPHRRGDFSTSPAP